MQVRRSNAGAGGDADEITERRALVSKLRQKCAVIRCNLETHVRAEEAELWPLFAEHFTIAEQSQLVGTIIGRTGAEVLQVCTPTHSLLRHTCTILAVPASVLFQPLITG